MNKLIFMLALSVSLQGLAKEALSKSDEVCAAVMLHKEAGVEPMKSQRATLDVALNRVKYSGKSLCREIKAPSQYSWVSHKTNWHATHEMHAKLLAVEKLPRVLDERYMWFFNKRLRPVWAKKMSCRAIGNHLYCRK